MHAFYKFEFSCKSCDENKCQTKSAIVPPFSCTSVSWKMEACRAISFGLATRRSEVDPRAAGQKKFALHASISLHAGVLENGGIQGPAAHLVCLLPLAYDFLFDSQSFMIL
ncbi:hypothetical protein O6H91_23G053900 [Diphasiastrum complanatum]|uniref:Uncharacterized protein n=1 Tax=Diphasiastrum complanatum TaxID=34168 RepID=A0ACC2AAS3_DIPCM|nr:hypothetical protein O6H91_23G053900 [Diphasiastrum complanatum]